jgi:predicted CXXCH cytochrome family protein
MQKFAAAEQAVSLGISCEACHLGSREHANNPKIRPRFFPAAPELVVNSTPEQTLDYGRTHTNLNWACGRCHTGKRPVYAGGLSTWNSIEFTDAQLGACYTKLRCIDCHDPHTRTGSKWTRPASETDQLCLSCHSKYQPPDARQAHTHHPAETKGSRCMSCHMPRINEGLQDVVRTHTIHSPTATEPLKANHLNACNLCHTSQPIAWTLEHLESWYDPDNLKPPIAPGNSENTRPVGTRWLASEHESVRLVGLDALARSQAGWALPRMLDALDDPFLVNRQFATRAIENWLKLSLNDLGYRFYMTAEQRQPVIRRLKLMIVPPP